MTAPPQATHVFTWKIISCNPFFKDESIPLSKLKRPKMWKIPLPVFLHTDGHNRHTSDTFFETNPLWILMSHMPHNPPHLLPGCSWCTTPPNLEDRIVVCWKKLRSVGLVGDFLAGLFWKKEACSKLGILFTFFLFFSWFCSKNHWWRTWMSLESEGLKKGSRSVDSRSSAWEEAGCPCWSCSLGRNWLCPSFSPIVTRFGHCPNPQINQMIAEVLDTKWRFTPKYARTGIPNVQQLLLNKAPQLVFTQVANVTKWLTRRTCEPGDGPNSAEPLIKVLGRGEQKTKSERANKERESRPLLNIFVLVCSLSMRHAHVVFQNLHVTCIAEIETSASSYRKNPVLSVFFRPPCRRFSSEIVFIHYLTAPDHPGWTSENVLVAC